MDHLLTCHECGKQLTVGKSQAGQNLQCECGVQLSVPTLRDFATLPVATKGNEAPETRSGREAWQSWRGPAIAVAALCFAIAFGFTCWFLLQLSLLDTSHNTEREIALGNELFDSYSPEELSLVWSNYEEVGVGQKSIPPYEILRRYALARKYLAAINGSIAGVFAVIMFGIWISAKRSRGIS